jgi:ankyrin repeat protein
MTKSLVLKAGINDTDPMGHTALNWACLWSNDAMVRMLLELGADPNIVHGDGRHSLRYAIEMSDLNKVRLLLEYGANYHTIPKTFILSDEIRILIEQYGHLDIKEPE